MADFPIKEKPEFSRTMVQVTTKDRGAPDTFNPRYQTLLDNDNYLKKQIDKIAADPVSVTLTVAGWTGSDAPFIQTVPAVGITADMDVILMSGLADGASPDAQKAYSKAFGIISSGTGITGDGTVTFKVYKKPASDCTVQLKGVL